jgi:hypothetical protein
LIGSGRPGFNGHYRVVRIGPQKAIEFFDGVPGKPGELPVKILPYRQGEIAAVTVGDVDEAISGEFTGCVMTLYRQGGTVKAGHVDTNKDSPQRDAYAALKSTGAITVLAEYDTTGKLPAYKQTSMATRILCVAGGGEIKHYFVNRETHTFHGQAQVPGENRTVFGAKTETRYRVLPDMGI